MMYTPVAKRSKKEANFKTYLAPAFDQVKGGGVLRGPDDEFDFVGSVARVADYVPRYLSQTPLYEYELLTQALKCQPVFKLENLQKFGDVYPRNIMSIVVSHYLNQKDALKKEFHELGGVIIVLDPQENFSVLSMLPIVLVTMAFSSVKLKPVIFVLPGTYSVLQCSQLVTAHACDAELIFWKGDKASCFESAKAMSAARSMILIEPAYNRQFGLIGAATVAHEILQQCPDVDTLVLPLRHYSVGWSIVYAMAFYIKIVKPSVRVVVTQMEVHIGERDGSEFRSSIFPDFLENGWEGLSTSNAATPRQIFDLVDARNQGVFTKDDMADTMKKTGADLSLFNISLGRDSFTLTEFIQQLHQDQFALTSSAFVGYMSLKNLQEKGLIDELHKITEDEASDAFLRCLQYTKTLTNGKGALPIAGFLTGRVKAAPNEKVACLISGGYIDVMDFQGIFEHAMGLMGQHFQLEVEIPDNATSLTKVLKVIADNGVSVREVSMFREAAAIYHVKVIITGYSRTFEQHTQVHEKLALMGYDCSLGIGNVLQHSIQPVSLPPVPPAVPAPRQEQQPLKVTPMEEVGPESIRAAFLRIRKNILTTPLIHSSEYSRLVGCQVYLKLDNLQKTGSFKMRGSSNMVLKRLERNEKIDGLITASAGNHAQGVSLVAKKAGLACSVVCPEWAPETKLSAVRQYGAEVLKVGQAFEDAGREAERLANERGWLLVRAFNDADVVEGQGTIGLEVFQELPDVDTVIVNVGGGGMIAGIALYMKNVNPKIRIVGVQAESVAPLENYKQTEELKYIDPSTFTLADGVNIKLPGGVHSRILRDLVDEYVTVRENEIAATIVHLMEHTHTLSEGAGCLGLAALLYGKVKVRANEKVCVVICGGNIDMSTLRQTYEYGLRALGRSFTVHVTMADSPGSLAKVIAVAAGFELKVQEVRHIRGVGDINWNEVTLSLTFYSNSFHHQIQFLNALVDKKLFPTVMGREFVRNHTQIYKAFDDRAKEKKEEMIRDHKKREHEFQQKLKAATSTPNKN